MLTEAPGNVILTDFFRNYQSLKVGSFLNICNIKQHRQPLLHNRPELSLPFVLFESVISPSNESRGYRRDSTISEKSNDLECHSNLFTSPAETACQLKAVIHESSSKKTEDPHFAACLKE